MKFDPFGNGDLELERPEFYKSLDLIEAVCERDRYYSADHAGNARAFCPAPGA